MEITETLENNDELSDDLEKYKVFVNNIVQATWETDANGTVVKDSPSWRAYTGQTYEEWLGYGWVNAIHPDDREYAERQWREAVAAVRNLNAEYRLRSPDGGWKWTNVLASPIFHSDGKLKKWIGFNIDISRNKESELNLLKKEQVYLEIIDSSSDGSFIKDIEKGELFVSDQWKKRLGIENLSPKEAASVLETNVHPDDIAAMNRVYTSALEQKLPKLRMEFRIETIDSGYIWILGQAKITYNDEGRPVRYFGTHMDITERKQLEEKLHASEERYHKIIDTANEGIVLVDAQGKISFVNNAVLKLSGYSSEELLQKEVLSFLTEDDRKAIIDYFKDKKRYSSNPWEINTRKKDGSSVWLSVSTSPFFDIDNNYNGRLIILSDITEHKKSEEELKRSLKIQDQMFSNVSHELRTPLNVLLGAVQLMKTRIRNEDEKSKRLLEAMKQNCYRLIRLVNNIIDISKIDSDFMNLNLKNYNIVSLVEEITLSIADYAKTRDIELIFDTDVEEKIMAADADALERILLNLLSNSVKFTGKNDTILVSVHDNETSVLISVKDTGIGIPEDKVDKIFQRYMQVSKDLNRHAEGTGIGLHLTMKLIKRLGGTISVRSKLNEGTEFIIALPVKLVGESAEEQHNHIKESLVEKINIEFSDIYSI